MEAIASGSGGIMVGVLPPPDGTPFHLPDAVPGLQGNWTFVPSRPPLTALPSRLKSFLTGYGPVPRTRALRSVEPRRRWNGYFVFAPSGLLEPYHLFTLERLRDLPGGLLVVFASPSADRVPEELVTHADALYWKGLSGFDFSAYSIALRAVAQHSPNADLFLMNDSVLGPLTNIESLLLEAPWDLTAFTANCAIENHLQSYGFQLRGVTPMRVRAFGSAIPANAACDRYRDVINLQETRFGRLAARRMSVGAYWYAGREARGDPSLWHAVDLAERGFPFVKRSLLARYAHFQDSERLQAILTAAGHPV